LFPSANRITYFNEATSASSVIDYILTSSTEKVVGFNIIDLDVNLSDHLPLLAICLIDYDCEQGPGVSCGVRKPDDVTYLRWDHAPTDLYYDHSLLLLQPVLDELDSLLNSSVNKDTLSVNIDRIYNGLIESLRQCAKTFIPKHKSNFYKFWWSQELDVLKTKAILSHGKWKDAGKPKWGSIFSEYKSDKLLYEMRLREEKANKTNIFINN
jgi:hypothetical protein